MPALNVEFTEEELDAVRAAAAAAGKTVKGYVHDVSVREQHRQTFLGAAATYWNGHLKEFDLAFPGETPAASQDRAA